MELGKVQTLKIVTATEKKLQGTDGKETIDLEIIKGESHKVGEEVEVFVYRENSGKLAGTTRTPKIEVGKVAKLVVVSKTKIGYFVDIGAPKDVLLPFTEASERVREGGKYLFLLYVDKSNRLAVTMNIKDHLKSDSPYEKGDMVKGSIYHINPRLGALIAIDDQYDGLIPTKNLKGIHNVGDEVEVRVAAKLEDGKLTLSMREFAHIQMGQDSEIVLDLIDEYKGVLPLGDKSDPEEILNITGLSKSAFKRAVGKLYKEGKAIPGSKETRKK